MLNGPLRDVTKVVVPRQDGKTRSWRGACPKHRTGNNHGRIYRTRHIVERRRNGKRVWRGKCASDPQLLAAVIRERAPQAKRVVFETGPLSVWFYHELMAQGVPAICIDARHAKAALDMAANKTDANDADGLAHLAEVGFYKEVRVKNYDSMLARTLVGARSQLVKIATELSNQIRGLMKTFGLIVPKGAGRIFCLPAMASLNRSSCHCSKPGAAFAQERRNLTGNW